MDAFTIIGAKLSFASTRLDSSLLANHPDGRLFVIMFDDIPADLDNSHPFAAVIKASDLGIPNWHEFTFKYNITEACTAIKPFCFKYLFERYDLRHVRQYQRHGYTW